jgi:hypothetical protein
MKLSLKYPCYFVETPMPEKTHFRVGGSTASRSLACPAWLLLRDDLPKAMTEQAPNDFADRGTLLHDLMEAMINDPELNAFTHVGKTLNNVTLTEEDIRDVGVPTYEAYERYAVDHEFVLELPECELEVSEDMGGTSDVIAVSGDTIYVLDFKFGHNLVSPEENAQGMFYASCAYSDYLGRYDGLFTPERTKVVIGIIQPAYQDQGKDIVQTWETDVQRLHQFSSELDLAVYENQDKANPITGEHCKYCPNITTCPAKTGQVRKALMIDPASATADVLAEALAMADEVAAWAKAVKTQAHQQMDLGLHLHGFKLVAKRARRAWKDEDAVMSLVRKARKVKLEQAVDMKLKSPAQLEKVCKQIGVDFKKYASYTESVSTGSTIASADDKRPELLSTSALASAIAQNI